MIYEMEKRENAASVFAGWEETMILSCLQGVMGHIYATEKENPCSAAAMLGDFCFYAGKPDGELAAFLPEPRQRDFLIAVPQNRGWAELLEKHYGDSAKKVVRYAMKKEPDVFDRARLEAIVRELPPEYTMAPVDEAVFHYCKEEAWCRDLVAQFDDWQTYQRLGAGVVVKKDGVPVSGASSYSAYHGGIEIEIDTKEEYRRKGLASVCGAALILECRKKGLYPSWDAQNPWSRALAEKLGYHLDYAYDAYEIIFEVAE